jgi:hypothetical protein
VYAKTNCGTASRIVSCARAGATSPPLRPLLGHSRIDTTQLYTDEIEVDQLADALAWALAARNAQASPDLATLDSDVAAALQWLEWRRRESNTRPRFQRGLSVPREYRGTDIAVCQENKSPALAGLLRVAGAGFEPATSGL